MEDSELLHSGVDEIAASAVLLAEDFREFPEILASIAETFREVFPVDMEALRRAVSAGDSAKVMFLAHKMRGSLLAFHQMRAGAFAGGLEQSAGEGDLSDAGSTIEVLAGAIADVNAPVEQAERMLAPGME